MNNNKVCECGIVVSGRTENILKANLKKHKKSKNHKNQMDKLRSLKQNEIHK